jgi:hypothetical protein
MEIHGSIVLPIALRVTNDFQTFLVNLFIVDLMLHYEAIITWVAPGCVGAVTTVLITNSHAGVGVHRPDVL